MIDLDPGKVLKNPWLWDQKTLDWAEAVLAQRRADQTSEKRSHYTEHADQCDHWAGRECNCGFDVSTTDHKESK